MTGCLIISPLAKQFAAETVRLAGDSISLKASDSPAAARDAYEDETVLFGNPAMIAEVLEEMPSVAWVQSSWAGVTPLIEASRRNYVLTGVKNVFGPQMAEYVLGHVLAHELRLFERRAAQRDRRWFTEPSGTLGGRRMGIMGTGSIGRGIASAAAAFGLCVTGLSRSGAETAGFERVYPVSQRNTFLEALDFLVAALPQTPATNNLLDAAAFRHLPQHALFINVGRSNVVDDAALMEALRTGRLGGAVLDVFDREPVPGESPLWETPNLTMTAHVAAISHPLLIVPIFVRNYRHFVRGEPLEFVVDFAAGY